MRVISRRDADEPGEISATLRESIPQIDISQKSSPAAATAAAYCGSDLRSPLAVDVCCGSEHSLVLTDEGKLFSFGWNEHGSCGNGDSVDLLAPCIVDVPSGIIDDDENGGDCGTRRESRWVKIGAGYGHSFALAQYE